MEEGLEPHHKILAYSDGSVLANGAAGSAAAIVCIGNSDAQATVRLASSADVALSSGRAEWGGLIMVLVIATGVSAAIELRLGNLQVVNTFNDGEWGYRRNWLRRNDRDMAMLAWALNDERVRAGKGPLTVIHQLGHPDKRKTAAEYDSHERYNVKVDHPTHAIRDDMPVYVPFSREYSTRTSLWHEPLEEENVGLGGHSMRSRLTVTSI